VLVYEREQVASWHEPLNSRQPRSGLYGTHRPNREQSRTLYIGAPMHACNLPGSDEATGSFVKTLSPFGWLPINAVVCSAGYLSMGVADLKCK
jgi:hypothetical protein